VFLQPILLAAQADVRLAAVSAGCAPAKPGLFEQRDIDAALCEMQGRDIPVKPPPITQT